MVHASRAVRPRAPSDAQREVTLTDGVRDLLVDALFGSGLTRALEGDWARLVGALAQVGRPIVAIDLPSGLELGDRHL